MVWLWLDDQPNTVVDIYNELKENKIAIEKFQNPAELSNFLIDKKDSLDKFGLILDVMLQGQKLISIPKAWSGKDTDEYKISNGMGHDAGLLFYEEFVLGISNKNEPFWKNPPPVLFLTVIDNKTTSFDNRLNNVKHYWKKHHNINEENRINVAWERKWERKSNFIDILKRYNNA